MRRNGNALICRLLFALSCLLIVGCAGVTGSGKVEVMKPSQLAGPPTQIEAGANKDVEVNIASWDIDIKYETVEKHYLTYFKEKGYKTLTHGGGYLFRNDTTEIILIPTRNKARAELRIAEITNGKPMPEDGLMAKGTELGN
jgi:uncharacterized protein (UPF0297 family)